VAKHSAGILLCTSLLAVTADLAGSAMYISSVLMTAGKFSNFWPMMTG
jgi:hypothetical protein